MATKAEQLKKKLAEEEAAFKKKQQQLKARLQLESAKERKARDKRETHVKVILGAIAIEIAEKDTDVHGKLQQWVQGYLESRPGDWPYFDDFPTHKDGKLLFALDEPRGWAEVVAARKTKKKAGTKKSATQK